MGSTSRAEPKSRPYSVSSQMSVVSRKPGKRLFVSYRLSGEYEKPWINDPKLKRVRYNNWIMTSFIATGFAVAAVVAFLITKSAISEPLCLIYDDDFKTFRTDIWSHEVQMGGFGTGSFDWTTTDSKNAYVDRTGLHIVPTLTNETTDITNDQIYNGYTLNLTTDGTCTGNTKTQCSIHSNSTTGALIPPVRSARLTTKGKLSIRYGRVEIVAKLPAGDWLWPAIWMMPEDSVYGDWPRSGEIDIMEARGNSVSYSGGRNIFFSTLHWGPSQETDAYWSTQSVRVKKRGAFSDDFHTYGLEWTDKYMYTYYDGRLTQVLYEDFDGSNPLWNRGGFSSKSENNTLFTNPWTGSNSTTGNAPFDQSFYLILNVAVGSRNGWFPDNVGGKPWLDAATNAPWTFWSKADRWLPTWGQGDARGMTIQSVKMWQAGACGAS
ncbi:concanavalin A-like lectin/glucanase [Thozetella sp. PMI_491]|nr:concanavalin A-like lectin/glucanase [Thozetella sp. PMI_491]